MLWKEKIPISFGSQNIALVEVVKKDVSLIFDKDL